MGTWDTWRTERGTPCEYSGRDGSVPAAHGDPGRCFAPVARATITSGRRMCYHMDGREAQPEDPLFKWCRYCVPEEAGITSFKKMIEEI